jgi:hypothetical protein
LGTSVPVRVVSTKPGEGQLARAVAALDVTDRPTPAAGALRSSHCCSMRSASSSRRLTALRLAVSSDDRRDTHFQAAPQRSQRHHGNVTPRFDRCIDVRRLSGRDLPSLR